MKKQIVISITAEHTKTQITVMINIQMEIRPVRKQLGKNFVENKHT